MPEEFEPVSSEPQEVGAPQAQATPGPEPQPVKGTGLQPNVAGALCYLLGLITGIVFLMIEKENRSVRFHAMQSILVSIVLIVVSIILGFIPVLGWALGLLVNLAAVALWILLMVKAYQGEEWEVPVLGGIARQQVAKM